MKKLLCLALTLIAFVLHGCGPTSIVVESPAPAPAPPPPPPAVSYQSFYDALSPYGQWINNPDYGYVWMPTVAPDFTPYGSNGHWVYTDEGWTWDSDYPWGWAAFHYGRWFFEDGYGWMWIPGNEWAPAWVSWRRSPDYYGWAPLGPQVSISASYGGSYNPPPHYWHFVPQQYVARPQVNNYFVSEQQNVTIVRNTTIIRNTTINNTTVNNTTVINNNANNRVTVNNYAGGPDPAEVSRVSGAPLRPIPLRESNHPGENSGGGAFSIYRPRINSSPSSAGNGSPAAAAPPRVQSLNQVRPVNPTSYNNTRPANNPNPSNANPAAPAPIGGNPAFNSNPGNAGNPANPGAQRPANNPVTTPVNNTPVNGRPVNNTPVNGTPPNSNHPAFVRPGTNNPPPVQPQPAQGNPHPISNRPSGTNQPATVKKPTPVARPLNQNPAGNKPKDKKDDKDSSRP
jgi:hypothetical protein